MPILHDKVALNAINTNQNNCKSIATKTVLQKCNCIGQQQQNIAIDAGGVHDENIIRTCFEPNVCHTQTQACTLGKDSRYHTSTSYSQELRFTQFYVC